MTTPLLVNIILSAAAFTTILGILLWSTVSHHSDRRHLFVRTAPRSRRVSLAPQFGSLRSLGQASPSR
jgi:hypothetical protein